MSTYEENQLARLSTKVLECLKRQDYHDTKRVLDELMSALKRHKTKNLPKLLGRLEAVYLNLQSHLYELNQLLAELSLFSGTDALIFQVEGVMETEKTLLHKIQILRTAFASRDVSVLRADLDFVTKELEDILWEVEHEH